MGSVGIESSCLSVDGVRRWMVSGVVDPTKMPRQMWGECLRGARDAGLNCVCVPVVWSHHEPVQGRFDFEGARDVGAFVREAQVCGLMVVLRAGPFVGDGHDRGGLPSWLEERDGVVLRSSHPEFLRASSRWYRALMSHLKGLMATDGGPIVMAQCEHRWFCGDQQEGDAYLGELVRYLREHGVRVPIVMSHNLFASVEGTIDAWSGHDSLFATVRQLRSIRADQPTMVMDLGLGRPGVWGEKPFGAMRGEEVVGALASVVAAGGQYQIGSFCGGVRMGFDGGRLAFERDAYLCPSADRESVIDTRGTRGEVFHAVRRVSSFVSGFESVLAAQGDGDGVVVRPGSGSATLVSRHGELGDVAWIFAGSGGAGKQKLELTLRDGKEVGVDLAELSCAWIVQGVHLDDQTRLDLCTMSVVGYRSGALVVVASSGARGLVVINGVDRELRARRGAQPQIVEHEGVRVVVCTPEQFESVQLRDDGVCIGASAIDADGLCVASGSGGVVRCSRAGEEKIESRAVMRAPAKPKITGWEGAGCASYIDGSNPRYARISGPSALEDLGTPLGYGWYRIAVQSSSARKLKTAWFGAGDRLHVWSGGRHAGSLGRGPGLAPAYLGLSLKKGTTTLAVLADNLGRASGGVYAGARRGVWEHVWSVKPMSGLKAGIEIGEPVSPMVFRKPITRLYEDDVTMPERPTWSFQWRKKSPVAMTLDVSAIGETTGLVIVNDEPVHCFADGGLDHVLLTDLRRGKNVVQLAMIGDEELLSRASDAVRFEECVECLSEGAEWSFAAWERAPERDFAPMSKKERGEMRGVPMWWRTELALSRVDRPLVMTLGGMSKGQVFVNGVNLCRYFVATSDGQKIDGQQEYVIHHAWLRGDDTNEIVLFDEHGCDPSRVSLRWG
ncbi:MAG: beta-galactosidase [Phycisphaerales bacterium JB043]